MASTNDLKNGMVLNIDGQLWSVVEFQHVKPGKGPAFVRTKLKAVLSGKVVDKTFNAGTKVDTANVDKRTMQYLYKDGSDFVFMDTDTLDQVHVGSDVVGVGRGLHAGEPERHRRHPRRCPALRRAPGVRGPRDHAHRARPAGRPLHRRHQAGDPRDRRRRSPSRCSSRPGTRVKVDTRDGSYLGRVN